MPKKRFTPEQIIAKLRQIEVQLPPGGTFLRICIFSSQAEEDLHAFAGSEEGSRVCHSARSARSRASVLDSR